MELPFRRSGTCTRFSLGGRVVGLDAFATSWTPTARISATSPTLPSRTAIPPGHDDLQVQATRMQCQNPRFGVFIRICTGPSARANRFHNTPYRKFPILGRANHSTRRYERNIQDGRHRPGGAEPTIVVRAYIRVQSTVRTTATEMGSVCPSTSIGSLNRTRM